MPTGGLCNRPRRQTSLFILFLFSCCFRSWFSPGAVRVGSGISRPASPHFPPTSTFLKSKFGHAGAERNPELVKRQRHVLYGERRLVGHAAAAGSMNVILQAATSQAYTLLCTGAGPVRLKDRHPGRRRVFCHPSRKARQSRPRAPFRRTSCGRDGAQRARDARAASKTFLLEAPARAISSSGFMEIVYAYTERISQDQPGCRYCLGPVSRQRRKDLGVFSEPNAAQVCRSPSGAWSKRHSRREPTTNSA